MIVLKFEEVKEIFADYNIFLTNSVRGELMIKRKFSFQMFFV